ncbi:pantetheine-phosphate adenylyltransferase [Halovenus sp. WSH3]|uniref:Phosphopantetheine adenylyltransferase n=1 Tax=Halovenus carboxidivorans TaxID=2692199 RepID=A0A6B0T2G0_9EURY|nr:pantetheine-phosphate adenylyltransferase [Halovenus carboxidivorans]
MTGSDRTAILGGTFTPIHNGHRALLHKAFQTASHDGPGDGHVIVGLTSSKLATETRENTEHAEQLGSYDQRRETLAAELDILAETYTASYEIVKLQDTYGPAATRPDADALIVSPEAKAQRRANELNEERIERGLDRLEIHTAPFVVAEDGTRISSTRIRNGEIDPDGRIIDD